MACEGKRFLREQIGHRRLKQHLCQELQQDGRALLEVRNASLRAYGTHIDHALLMEIFMAAYT